MLVLRRRIGESLLIGDDIEIEFLELSNQTVKIGISAPKDVCILRKELKNSKAQDRASPTEFSDLKDSEQKRKF